MPGFLLSFEFFKSFVPTLVLLYAWKNRIAGFDGWEFFASMILIWGYSGLKWLIKQGGKKKRLRHSATKRPIHPENIP